MDGQPAIVLVNEATKMVHSIDENEMIIGRGWLDVSEFLFIEFRSTHIRFFDIFWFSATISEYPVNMPY